MSIYEKYGLKPYGQVPNERQMEWYRRERTIFFHFGMNTFTNKEWGDGDESPSMFNPSELNVEQWIKAIKEAGFGMAILTAKHHDGFCLWQTKYTEHSIKNSPYKNGQGDIVKEFTDACKKHGIKAGIYLSPWDRHEKTWGKEEYNDFYVGQLEELLTNYGEIYECWWDGAGSTEAVYDWDRWAKTVKALQPKAVIFGSLGATPYVDVRWVGNEKGIAGKPCYATIDEISLIIETTSELNHGKLGGERFIPAEVDVSIRPGWFYHAEQDENVRTPENLIELWFSSTGSNAGLLLNLPPDRRGLIHENDVKSIKEFNRILTETFSKNLLSDAKIEATSQREGCEAEGLLKGGFYAPKDNEKAELIITLPEKREINALMIGEAIELGHKVTKIQAYAFAKGEWKELFEREMIGYKLVEPFESTVTDKIKISIPQCLDTPVIDKLGAYLFPKKNQNEKQGEDKKNLALSTQVKGNIIDVNLGGIFPFNLVRVKNVGECTYKILAFNGTQYEYCGEGKAQSSVIEHTLDTVIDYSYTVRIELDKNVPEHTETEVFKVEK